MNGLPSNLLADFRLSKEERESPLWQSLLKRFDEKLQDLRSRNDDANLSEPETARLRGHIQCLKFLRDLGKEPPPRQVPHTPNVTATRQGLV